MTGGPGAQRDGGGRSAGVDVWVRVRWERGDALCGREAPTAWAQKAGCARAERAAAPAGAGRWQAERGESDAGCGERAFARARAGPRAG